MKIFQILVLITSICGFSFFANAQADCIYNFRLSVLDEKGKAINNAEVGFEGRKLSYYNDTKDFSFSHFGGCGKYKGLLKVNAEGFNKFEKDIGFVGFIGYELRLKAKNSEKPTIFEELAILKGSVKDANGAVIPKVQIALKNDREKVVETFSNDNGYFDFMVHSGKYKLEFNEVPGFAPKIIENFELSKGYKYLDVVLKVKSCNDPTINCDSITSDPIKNN
jgi:Carboxypeptidase regulatory-like domain